MAHRSSGQSQLAAQKINVVEKRPDRIPLTPVMPGNGMVYRIGLIDIWAHVLDLQSLKLMAWQVQQRTGSVVMFLLCSGYLESQDEGSACRQFVGRRQPDQPIGRTKTSDESLADHEVDLEIFGGLARN